MSFALRPFAVWQLRTRELALGRATAVMGIVNVTPDSFSEGAAGPGGYPATGTHQAAVERGLALLAEGATMLDIGGESTRPGSHAATSAAISAGEEQARVLPVIEAILRKRPDTLLSIDTYRASTARAAIEAGCEIVNDVSGLLWDPHMAETCAELGCGLVLMHTRGRPEQWRKQPRLAAEQVLPLVERGLGRQMDAALAAGVAAERIVLDPGYGFGKAFDTNYVLLAGQSSLLALGRPLLAGVSRKSFLGRTLAPFRAGVDAPSNARAAATIAATVAAVLAGASLIRVHEVRETLEAVAVADAILAAVRT